MLQLIYSKDSEVRLLYDYPPSLLSTSSFLFIFGLDDVQHFHIGMVDIGDGN